MKLFLSIAVLLMITVQGMAQKVAGAHFNWGQLPEIPDAHGFAGSFAGVSNGALIVAGGANFPDGGGPWTGAKKAWSDKVFVLKSESSKWVMAGTLPHALGYGVSIIWNNQLLCFGGSNENGHCKEVIGIRYQKHKLSFHKYPDMPATLANSAGVLVGHTVYIAGGLIKPDDTNAAHNFWSLDLSAARPEWKTLPAWPGAARMLSIMGTQGGSIYLFSGASLHSDGKGGAERTYLTDAYSYQPGKGWHQLKSMPCATVAAAGPAYAIGHKLFVFGGDDGKLVKEANSLREKHPGFSDQILSYDITTNKWANAGHIKTNRKADAAENPNGSLWAPVTTCLTIWNGKLVFAGGEVRPAVRTPRVLMATPANKMIQ